MFYCGKCGSANLHRDDDTLNDLKYIACFTCGNRYPPGPEPIIKREAIKKGVVMATARKKGTCNNCERTDMYLPAFGKCWVCYDERRNALKNGTSVEEALAGVRGRIRLGMGKKGRLKTKKTPGGEEAALSAAGIMAEETKTILEEAPGWVVPSVRGVCLEFKDDRDKGMFDWLRERADESRRNPEQQIMWILQHYIEAEKGLDDAGKLTPEP